MDIIITRLNSVAHIHQFWKFFKYGFEIITRKTGDVFDDEEVLPLLHHLVSRPTQGYISLCRQANTREPLGFLIAHDSTPLFAKEKGVMIKAAYFHRGRRDIQSAAVKDFEQWMIDNGYSICCATTKRHASPAIRFFKERYNMKQSYMIFERRLTNADSKKS